MTTETLAGVWCVIVHHRSLDTLTDTVADVTREIAPERLVVVDNSGDLVRLDRLTAVLPAGSHLIRVANRGYAHAVNVGVDHVLRDPRAQSILVLTHEVRLCTGAVSRLCAHLRAGSRLGAVGPRLLRDGDPDHPLGATVWSEGGRLTRWLRLPAHRGHGTVVTETRTGTFTVDWLDGSAVMYPASLLREHRMLESFFLYDEEREFHTRIRGLGLGVAVARDVFGTQQTGGTPGFLRGRNGQYFQFLHGTPLSAAVAVPFDIFRMVGLAVLGRCSATNSVRAMKGWATAWRTREIWVQAARGELARHHRRVLPGGEHE